MKQYKIIVTALLSIGILFTSCVKDLDTVPLNTEILTSATAFSDTNTYVELLAKIYGALTLTGQKGPSGDPESRDILEPSSDEGYISFLRMYWNAQETTTDESINAWGDANQVELHGHTWSDQNFLNKTLYQRVFISITLCNEYIRVVGSKVGGLTGNLHDEVTQYIAEAKFLRALNYSFAIDLWGNVPFVTEADATGAFLPPQIKRADLFAYIELELKNISAALLPPNQNPQHYAKANRAAAWMLLAKLYLNAEVYLGNGNTRYTECINYCDSIMKAGYSLHPNYRELFLADNHTCLDEIIFPIAEDGLYTQNYGGVNYIISASCPSGNNVLADFYGIKDGPSGSGWSGNRFPSTFSTKFTDLTGDTDQRAQFYTLNRPAEITLPNEFTQGYLSTKFRNITSTGEQGQSNDAADTDFPLFRLGDVYLMYAEAVLRGGTGGDLTTALGYVNDIRERAYGNKTGNISESELTLPFLIDERARELQWEAKRRTDLIRFGLFTGDGYIWEWKGDVKEGIPTDSHYNLFPIPSSDLGINTNLVQNPGY